MIKKMYTTKFNINELKQSHKHISEEYRPLLIGYKDDFKEINVPVWVCDRDPHENVKRVMETRKSEIDTLSQLNYIERLVNALQKDLKNTEGAG